MRQLVLQMSADGCALSLFADGDAGELRFYSGDEGAHGDAVGARSFTWAELLENELRPRAWLLLHPVFVHPSIADLVVRALEKEPREGVFDDWWRLAALRPTLPAPENGVIVDLFACSDTARALGQQGTPLVNRPQDAATWEALRSPERELLEPIAQEFGVVAITYGFAGPELVRAVRKRATADHRLPNINRRTDQHAGHERNTTGQMICSRGGVAVDLTVTGVASMDVTDWVSRNLPFDRLYRYPPISSTDPTDRPFHLSW
jgi:hypothetical protein